jgi:2-polyprenyl-6-methoxyphenol hydroxylase-like FAD-dependent oxidoreductase
MGNAAHLLHPVAGQGFNLALRDVLALAKTIDQAQRQGQDWASLAVLKGYLALQAQDQWMTTTFSDRLPDVFASQSPLLSLLSSIGLTGLDIAAPLRKNFVLRAAGLTQSREQMFEMAKAEF